MTTASHSWQSNNTGNPCSRCGTAMLVEWRGEFMAWLCWECYGYRMQREWPWTRVVDAEA